MAEGVVDLLEPVQVQVHHCQRLAFATRLRHRQLGTVLQQHAVGQVGQWVVLGQAGHALGHGNGISHIAQHRHRTRHRTMAVGDGAGSLLHLESLPSGAVHQHAPHRFCGRALLHYGTQRAGQGLVVVWAAQAHHLIHVVHGRIKRLPACQALGHRVEVGHHAFGIRAHHGVANGLQREAHALFLVEQFVLHALALGDVRHLHKKPGDHAARVGVWQVRHDAVARQPVWALVRKLKPLGRARQRQVVVGLAGCIAGLAQQFADVSTSHWRRVGSKLLQCRTVCETVAHSRIPVGDHGRRVVEGCAQIVLGLGKTGSHLLAQPEFSHKKHCKYETPRHQQRSKAAKNLRIARPLGRNGLRCLSHIHYQRVISDRAKCVQSLYAIKSCLAHKRARSLGLKTQEVGRARNRLAHICIAIWETGDNHAILPEQVDTTVRAQVQRTEQFIEETQGNAANNHACETAIGLEVRSRDGQDVKSSHPRQDWLAKERSLLPMLTEGKKIVTIRQVDSARCKRA